MLFINNLPKILKAVCISRYHIYPLKALSIYSPDKNNPDKKIGHN